MPFSRPRSCYSNQQQLEKAIPLLERVLQTQPKQRLLAVNGLVPLYFKSKEPTKALALVDQLLKENATDAQTYYAMASLLQNNGKYDEARRLLTRLKEIDPQQTDQVRNQIAGLAKMSGKLDEAFTLNRETLFAESQRPSYYGQSRRIEIYSPELDPNRGRSYGNPFGSLPNNAFGGFPWEKANAFGELKIAAKAGADKGTNIFEEMDQVARSWSPSLLPSQRDRAWNVARILIGHYALEKEFDKATNLLVALRKAGFEGANWFNISIYVAEQKEDFTAMIEFYDELQQRYPAKARDITIARAGTYLFAKKYDDAAKVVRTLNEQRVPPAQILGLIGRLQQAGEKKLAQSLLEEHLSGVSRNPQALSMLASLYAENNDFDKAIALANEAWERKAHGSRGGGFYYGYYGYMPQFGQVDELAQRIAPLLCRCGQKRRTRRTVQADPGETARLHPGV